MKKLLLLINVFILTFASCKSSKKTTGEVAVETKSTVQSVPVKDSAKSGIQTTGLSGTAGGVGVKKDSLSQINTGHAVNHPTPPNQEKIDSIKNAKTKKEY